MFDAISQPYCVIYGGQFTQPKEPVVHGSQPATFRKQLATTSPGIRTPNHSGEGRVVFKADI